MWRRAGQQQADQPSLKLYYAGDFHGVQAIWRKFLRAGKFYDAQALIMGGDLGGKAAASRPAADRSALRP